MCRLWVRDPKTGNFFRVLSRKASRNPKVFKQNPQFSKMSLSPNFLTILVSFLIENRAFVCVFIDHNNKSTIDSFEILFIVKTLFFWLILISKKIIIYQNPKKSIQIFGFLSRKKPETRKTQNHRPVP